MKIIKEYFLMMLGSLLTAIGLNVFFVPNSIASGGAGGIGTVLYISIGIPVSLTVLAVNCVLFAFGYRYLKGDTLVKTVAATIMLSAFLELTADAMPITGNLLLASIYGGLCVGTGTGLTIVSGGSTGGSDLAALIVHRFFPSMTVPRLILIIDLSIIVLSGIVFSDYEVTLYAAISMYICSVAADAIIEGVNFSKLVFVISMKSKEIAETVMRDMERGITSLRGTGMYSGSDIDVLMCAVRKSEFIKFRKIVKQADENAFIILTDAREVFGDGFKINE